MIINWIFIICLIFWGFICFMSGYQSCKSSMRKKIQMLNYFSDFSPQEILDLF